MNEPKTYWLAKYALNGGVKEIVHTGRASAGGHIYPQGTRHSYKIGKDVFESRGAAVAAAETMRLKKIASLKKQLAKLEKLKFE